MRFYDIKAITCLVDYTCKFDSLNITSHCENRTPTERSIGCRPVPSGSVASNDINVYDTGKSIFCGSMDTRV